MSHPSLYQTNHWEGADLVLMARVRGADAQNIVQGTVSSISLEVYDLSDESQVGATTALTVSSVVFDTLQTDDRWTADSVGYNFRATIDGSFFPEGGRDYRVEIVFTPTSGSPFPLVAEVSVQNLMGS